MTPKNSHQTKAKKLAAPQKQRSDTTSPKLFAEQKAKLPQLQERVPNNTKSKSQHKPKK
jgi:hypothetical protein